MAIVRQAPNLAKMYLSAAQAAGKARGKSVAQQRRDEQLARSQAMAVELVSRRLVSDAAAKDAAARERIAEADREAKLQLAEQARTDRYAFAQMDLETRKMFHSLDRQSELERFARNKQWEMDKIDLTRKARFTYDLEQEMTELAKIDANIKHVKEMGEQGRFDEETTSRYVEMLEAKKLGLNVSYPQTEEDTDMLTPPQLVSAATAMGKIPEERPGWVGRTFLGAEDVTEEQLQVRGYLQSLINQTVAQRVMGEPTEQKPIIQQNRKTGAYRVSYDGGNTWQPMNR